MENIPPSHKRKLHFDICGKLHLKIPKVEILSPISEDDVFVQLDLSCDVVSNEKQTSEWWVKNLGLTVSDKDDIKNNKKIKLQSYGSCK